MFVNPLEILIFLHKYDLKRHQIFTQVLIVNKVNTVKLMSQQFYASCNY